MKETKKVSKQLIETIEPLLYEAGVRKGDAIVCALSGGRDSVCLFFLLKALSELMGFTLFAVHVDHNLRENAKKDALFCKALCEENKVCLFLRSVDVTKRLEQDKGSVEEAARELRYQAFEEVRSELLTQYPTVWIALAHHQKDQAETVLMHLLRGSGVKGLSGMKPVRGAYLRPLLDTDPGLLDQMIEQEGLSYREDESNQDVRFTRNRIRKELLPLLGMQYNPEIVSALCKTAALSRIDDEFLEQEAKQRLEKVLKEPQGSLCISALLSEPKAMQLRMIVLWLRNNGLEKDQSFEHVNRVLEVAKGRTGRRISLPSSLTLQKSYDILECIRKRPFDAKTKAKESIDPIPEGYALEVLDIKTALEKSKAAETCSVPADDFEKWMDADLISCPVWRKRRPGDYLKIKGGRKKLKKLLIDEKIPQEKRDRLWLLADGAHVLWVPGVRMSEGAKLSETTVRVLRARVKKEESNAE